MGHQQGNDEKDTHQRRPGAKPYASLSYSEYRRAPGHSLLPPRDQRVASRTSIVYRRITLYTAQITPLEHRTTYRLSHAAAVREKLRITQIVPTYLLAATSSTTRLPANGGVISFKRGHLHHPLLIFALNWIHKKAITFIASFVATTTPITKIISKQHPHVKIVL